MEKLTLSRTEKAYNEKPNTVSALKFENGDTNIDEFASLIGEGFAFCHTFNTLSNKFGCSEKNKDLFVSASFVWLDIDETTLGFDECIEAFRYRPTIAYTSYRDGIFEGVRKYRLIYVFEEAITSIIEYKCLWEILKENSKGVEVDTCSRSAIQYMNGSNRNNKGYRCKVDKEATYHIADVLRGQQQMRNIKDIEEEKIHNTFNTAHSQLGISKKVSENLLSMPYTDLLDRNTFPIYYATPVESIGRAYIPYPKDFVSVNYYWLKATYVDEFGEETRRYDKPLKTKDGNGRKKQIFKNTCRRIYIARQQGTEITADLIYTYVVYEFYHYIDNRKDPITQKHLLTIVGNVIDYYNDNKVLPNPPSKWMVDREYMISNGLTMAEARNEAKKQYNEDTIGNLYDPSLTDKQNLSIFNEYGVKVSQKTLTRFKQRNGLTRGYGKGNSNWSF